MKKAYSKCIAAVSLLLCFSLIFNITAFAGNILPQDSDEEFVVIRQCGVLVGESIQLKAKRGGEIIKAVTWFSSNPSAISCSASGVITGLKAGGHSDITCKYNNETITMTVYCVEKLPNTPEVYLDNLFVSVYAQPESGTVAYTYVNFAQILRTLLWALTLINQQSVYWGLLNKCRLYGWVGDYAYIRFGNELQCDGFVNGARIMDDAHGMLKISQSNMIVWADGVADPENKLTSNKSNANWTVNDAQIVTYNPTNGQVTGLKPGVTTIDAVADGFKKTCYVYSLYKWPVEWTGTLIDGDYLYRLNANEFYSDVMLAKGSKFTVYGDTGSSDGYAYGCTEEGRWCFVPISEISTKNTISFYRNLDWGYPLENKEYNYVNSPYSPRPSLSDLHRGFDINEKSNQTDIAGQKIIASFDGTVKKIGADLNKTNGCGYYICITSKDVDPVTGRNIIVIYQHMKSAALVSETDEVKKGQLIGYVGDTGRSNGSHLHFEVNNWNAAIGDTGRSDFTYTINPLYFYMDMVENGEIEINYDCSSVNSGYSVYFYKYDEE